MALKIAAVVPSSGQSGLAASEIPQIFIERERCYHNNNNNNKENDNNNNTHLYIYIYTRMYMCIYIYIYIGRERERERERHTFRRGPVAHPVSRRAFLAESVPLSRPRALGLETAR